MKRLSDIGEFGFIDLIKKGALKRPGVIKGIGDDTAVLSLNKDKFLLFTTDMLIEDVHFLASAKARDIGYKAMACNISDIADIADHCRITDFPRVCGSQKMRILDEHIGREKQEFIFI